ncbi:DedA family protein [Virgibacillus soli]|uniref:DedA family protein n=1 Tax=Paracerasibacillus soli TaxID=480284 RepID=A0ABU5CVB6_9BACI|nr:DedA family protein [Virgibacillus soli]MDY0410323.1 DedA family protein [Virgibacillus soli]
MGTWYEFISQFGYVAIFGLLTLGIIGLPVPDEVLLTYLGYVTSIGKMSFTFTFLTALLGSVLGISISYYLGLKLGEPFIKKYGKRFFISERTFERAKRLFHKYGAFMLVISYFIPGIRHVAAYMSGITRYSFKRFALFAYTGAVFWVLLFLVIGNRLGVHWNVIFLFTRKYMWSMIVLLVVCIVFGTIYYRHRLRKQNVQEL